MIGRANTFSDTVLAVFSSEHRADAATHELQAIGFDYDELGSALANEKRYRLLDNASRSAVSALLRGAVIGAPVGLAAALIIDFAAGTGLMAHGITEVIVFGVLGALWGSIIGAHLGLIAELHRVDMTQQRSHRALHEDEVLLTVVEVGSRSAEVEEIIDRNGGWWSVLAGA